MYTSILRYLVIASRDPKKIIDALEKDARFKLKGVGPISYHLGCDYTRDADGTLSVGPRKYIEKMIGAYEQMFGESPKNHSSPLERNDHPEVDESDELTRKVPSSTNPWPVHSNGRCLLGDLTP